MLRLVRSLYSLFHFSLNLICFNRVDYFEEKGHAIPHMEEIVVFEKALRTWAPLIDTKINPKHTQVDAQEEPRM